MPSVSVNAELAHHLWPEGVVQGLQSFFLQIDITEIVIHEADEPDAVVDFLDADGLAGQAGAYVDFFAIEAQTAAVGDDDSLVVERVDEFLNALVRASGRRVDLRRTFHVQSFVRTFVVELLKEGVELGLLLQEIGAGWARGFFFEGQVHALVATILLGMTGPNAFDADTEPQPPDREPGEIEKPVGRGEGNAIIRADRLR